MTDPEQPVARVSLVTLDALGTLVEVEPPWVHLARALGVEADERLIAAVRAEFAYYRDHSAEGRDARSLAELRERCAAILSEGLGRAVSAETMMGAIRFRAYPDAVAALAQLRSRGRRLVCVSNWDCSLGEVLRGCGFGGLLDGVVTSAGAQAKKPDPAIFAAALELAGCPPERALHVGDTPEEDIEGARAAGIRALLIDREGGGDISSLAELPQLLPS